MQPAPVKKAYTPWKVSVPKKVTGTRLVRKFFASPEAAWAYIARVHAEGFEATEKGRREEEGPRAMRVGEALAAWKARNQGTASSTFSQIKYVASALEKSFGRRPVESIDHRELDVWIRSIEGNATTKWNHHRVARRFFRWCHEYLEIIPRNPFTKVPVPVADRTVQGERIEILSPDQMADCLREAGNLPEPDRGRAIAYLCLGGFAGLRTKEIIHAHWEDLDFQSGEIYVRQPKRVRGWQPRYVRMEPALRTYLEGLRPQIAGTRHGVDGKFQGNSQRIVPGGQRTIYLFRRAIMDRLGWKRWPTNCLRHSYGTYWLAEFKDLAALRGEMGHESEDVTRSRYAMPAKRAAAAAWWGLRPTQ